MSAPFDYEKLPNGPDWWVSGANIRNRYDHQRATALIDYRGRAIARLERGIAGMQELQVVWKDWEPDPGAGIELTESQVARIAYEADRALRTALGKPGITEWLGLNEGLRSDWMAQVEEGGTDPHGQRPADQDLNRLRTKMLLALRDCLRASSA